jgi:hypothetical protein
MCATIVSNLGGLLDVDGEIARRVRCTHHAMAPTKRTAVVPQALVHPIDIGAIDDSESAAMTSALIFLHRAFLAIDRSLAHWGSPDATTSTNLCCTKVRDHVNFDARAEWYLRHTDGTARMDAPLAEHLDK